LKSINSSAQYLRTSFSTVDPLWVLDINSYSLNELPALLVTPPLPLPPPHHCSDDSCPSCGHDSPSHTHSSPPPLTHSANILSTYGFSFPGKMNLHDLMSLLDSLLYSFADGGSTIPTHGTTKSLTRSYGRIFRMKGVFHIENQEYLHLMQAVHDVFDIQPSSFRCGSADDKTSGLNSVIVIGKNLDQEYIEGAVKRCLVSG
jgi:G3E family GTPase